MMGGMATWTTVNLPWNLPSSHRYPILPERPEAPFWRRDLCEGMTWGEYLAAHDEKQRVIWAREGIQPGGHSGLSEAAKNEIEANRVASSEVLARIMATPEMIAWSAECDRIRKEHEASYFSNKVEVGMLIEFKDGTRLLVGDMASDGTLGGCCPVDVEEDAFVVRYTYVELPE